MSTQSLLKEKYKRGASPKGESPSDSYVWGYTNKVPDARSDAGVPEDRCAIATATLTGDARSSAGVPEDRNAYATADAGVPEDRNAYANASPLVAGNPPSPKGRR